MHICLCALIILHSGKILSNSFTTPQSDNILMNMFTNLQDQWKEHSYLKHYQKIIKLFNPLSAMNFSLFNSILNFYMQGRKTVHIKFQVISHLWRGRISKEETCMLNQLARTFILFICRLFNGAISTAKLCSIKWEEIKPDELERNL